MGEAERRKRGLKNKHITSQPRQGKNELPLTQLGTHKKNQTMRS